MTRSGSAFKYWQTISLTTFGADMARSGVRLPILQKMMGHADSKTTLQYINLSMADVAAEFQRAAEEIHKRYNFK